MPFVQRYYKPSHAQEEQQHGQLLEEPVIRLLSVPEVTYYKWLSNQEETGDESRYAIRHWQSVLADVVCLEDSIHGVSTSHEHGKHKAHSDERRKFGG